MSEASLNDVQPSSTPTALGSPRQDTTMPSSGTTVQRRSVLHTEEIVSLSFCNVFKCARDSSQHLFFPAILTYIKGVAHQTFRFTFGAKHIHTITSKIFAFGFIDHCLGIK